MKLQSFFVRTSLLFSAAIMTSGYFVPRACAQQQPDADADNAAQAKFPAAKRLAQQSAKTSGTSSASQSERQKNQRRDSAEEIRKREEWFYKQRASANGHIPAGARARALQHMQRMMVREGKLVQRPDGSFAEVAPQLQVTPLGAVSNPWTSIGPTPTTGGTFSPVTGRITTIAVDPSDTTGNTVLIGGAQGGIWRSTTAGSVTPTWTPVGDQNASLAMGSIAFAPSSPTTVYAGTGEQASIGFDIYYGAGVLKSTDSGQTWTQTCNVPSATCPFIGPTNDATPFGFFTEGGTRISYIAVNPANASMILVAAQTQFTHGSTEGVYCSADGGNTWNIVPTASGNMATFVGFASSTVAFAALGDPFGDSTGGNGIFQSTTASSCALTFMKLSAGLPPATSMGRIDMGISPLYATDKTVYASIADAASASDSNLGVFVSTNGGTSWTQLTNAPDICQQQCWYDNVIKVDPNGGAHAFLGGAAVSSSAGPIWVMSTANTGATWTSVIPNALGPGLPHVDNHTFAFAKLSTGKIRMYLGNDGGIWRTDDAEATSVTWTNLNDSLLTLTQFYPAISVHPSSPLFAFAGTQDNGSQNYAGPNTTWTDNGICGDGTGTAIDNVIPSTVYVTCNGNNINVSTQNGQLNTFLSATNGINLADNANFVPPLVTDPSAPNVVYTGTTKVYQSVNTGTTWTALSGGGDLVNGANGDSLIALAVAPTNSAVVYAGASCFPPQCTGGRIYVATNVNAGTGTFNAVSGSLPPRQVSAIAVDAADPTGMTAYAAFSGFAFGTDTTGHLFKTTDGGATWTDVSCTTNCLSPTGTDLPNTPVNDVVIDPDIAGTLYVGTDIGVFEGTCTTTAPFTCTWATLMNTSPSTSLPRVAVLSLKLHRASRTLFAATHGRGTWTIQLNNFTFTGPHISSLSPVSILAGSGVLTLTVNGSGLTNGAVQWNGSTTNVTTTPVSDSRLTATIAAALTGGGEAAKVTVLVGATMSNALTFTVLGGAPTITNATPTSANLNATGTQITVTGTNFGSNSVVVMNPDVGGTAFLTPTSGTSTQLVATIPASFMAGFGSTNSVGVQNPPPGGGTTNSASNPVALPTFTVIAHAPVNDNFANAVNITGTSFTDTKDTSAATTQTADPVPACSQIAGVSTTTGHNNTIWYKFVPTGSGTANIDTIGSSYDSVLSVWSGTSQSALAAVACNDDINPGIVVQSQLTSVPLTAGTTYYIMVSSFGGLDPNPLAFGGKSVLNFSFTGSSSGGGTATTTTVTSSSTNLPAGGGSVTLTATVVGSGSGASPTGTVQFMNGYTALGAAQTCSAVSGATSPTCKATLTTTLAFLVPPSGPQRMPTLRVQPVFLVLAVVLLTLFILGLSRMPARYRRVYASITFLLLVGFALGMVACGGGYGGGGTGGVHYDTITAVYSGDTTYAGSTSPSITITVQ